MKPGPSTFRNWLALLIEQGSRHLLGLLIIPYILRIYSPAVYGPLLIAQALAGILVMLVDYGFNFTAVQAIAENRTDLLHRSRISGEVLTLRSALSLLLWPVYGLVLVLLHLPLAYVLVCYIPVLTGAWFPNWVYQGVEQMVWPARLQILGQVLFVGGVFAWVHTGTTPLRVAVIQAGVALLTTFMAWVLLQRSDWAIHWITPSFQRMTHLVTENFPIVLGVASAVLFTTGNTFLVGFWGTAAMAGIFGIAWKFFSVLLTLTNQIQTVLYPKISRIRVETPELALPVFRRYLYLAIGGSVLLCIGAQFSLPWLLPWLTGPAYLHSLGLLETLAYSLPLVALNALVTNLMFLNQRKHWTFSLILLTTAVWDLTAVYLVLYWHLNVNNLGWAYLSTELFETILLLFLYWNPFTRLKACLSN